MSDPGTSFNLGRDAVMTVLVNGQPLALALTNFEFKQQTTRLTSKPINSATKNREIPEGWEGTADWDRLGPQMDDLFAALEAASNAGQPDPAISIMQRISELDGSISRYRFTGVTVKMDDGGSYKKDDKIMQRMGWAASRRLKV